MILLLISDTPKDKTIANQIRTDIRQVKGMGGFMGCASGEEPFNS